MKIERLRPGQSPELTRATRLLDHLPSEPAIRSYLADDRNVVLLATEEGVPVGFLRGTELGQISSERPQMFLYEISVDAPYRRRGIGRALIHALLEYCRARNFEEVFVLTDPANAAAVGLYRSTGGRTETPADRMFVYKLDPRR